MKTTMKMIVFALFFLFVTGVSSFAFDIGFDAWAGNLGFRTDRPSTDTGYPGADYFWGGSLYAMQPLSDTIRFEGGFTMDPILRNVTFALLNYTEKMLTVGVGPFMGVFNDSTVLVKSGISMAVKIELPGILFASLRSDSTIGGELLQTGDYLQERNDVSLGFYVKNAICTLGMQTKKFSQLVAAVRVVDSLTTYSFQTDIFQKNVPFRLGIALSYQNFSKSYVDGATTASNILNSIIVGTRLDISLSDFFIMYANLEANLYSFGQGQLIGATTDSFLFRASTGFRLNLDTFGLFNIY